MSIIIKGMKMPAGCPMCKMSHWHQNTFKGCEAVPGKRWAVEDDEEYANSPGASRPPWCPIIEIPEPHGRLIDGDIAEVIVYEQPSRPYEKDFVDGILYAADWIAKQPTVVPAEEESE